MAAHSSEALVARNTLAERIISVSTSHWRSAVARSRKAPVTVAGIAATTSAEAMMSAAIRARLMRPSPASR